MKMRDRDRYTSDKLLQATKGKWNTKEERRGKGTSERSQEVYGDEKRKGKRLE